MRLNYIACGATFSFFPGNRRQTTHNTIRIDHVKQDLVLDDYQQFADCNRVRPKT